MRERAYLSAAFSFGTSLVFFLTAVVPLPLPLYYPLARRWTLGPPGPELSMDYYGRSLAALLGGAAAVLLCLLALRLGRRGRRTRGPLLALCVAWTATALILCVSLYTYKLVGRDLTPTPLPAWYEPR